MQVFLVLIVVSLACFYLGKKGYDAFFSSQTKCEGCAFSKMDEVKSNS